MHVQGLCVGIHGTPQFLQVTRNNKFNPLGLILRQPVEIPVRYTI